MKRRSPWLAFAACVLFNGPLRAEPVAKTSELPTLGISKAASVAEAELTKRGLAKDHTITRVSLVSDQGQAPYYVARIEPLAPASAAKDTVEQKGLAFYVAMDGQVTAKELPQSPHRVRVIKSN